MANFSFESLILDLQKIVVILVNKVESLEAVITEQSGIIANLNPSTKLPTRKSLTPIAPVPTTSAVQRPVRNARVQASLAIAELAKPTKKRTNVRASIEVPASKKKATPDNPAATSDHNSKLTNTLRDVTVTRAPTNILHNPPAVVTTTASRVTITPAQQEQSSPTKLEDATWQTINRKRTKPRKILTGSGKADDILQTVEEMKYVQIWSLKPDTTEENIKNYLSKISKCDRYFVKKRVIKTDAHAAFEIGFPQNLYAVVSSPESWPPGVKISDWFRRSPRQFTRRGSLSAAGPSGSTSQERSACDQ